MLLYMWVPNSDGKLHAADSDDGPGISTITPALTLCRKSTEGMAKVSDVRYIRKSRKCKSCVRKAWELLEKEGYPDV